MNLADVASPLLALVGAWIAVRQLAHAKQYDGAQQITVGFETIGVVMHSHNSETENVYVELHYRGFTPLHGIRVCLMFEDESFWVLAKDSSLAPGEKLGPKYLEVPRSALPGLRLHVSWPTPHPSLHRKGLRYQALYVTLDQELREWRWLPLHPVLRVLRLPLGQWKKVNRKGFHDGALPGWPTGKPWKVVSLDQVS